jgi:hypothetical protein
VPYAQQHYISANYTHAPSYLLERGLNVVTQLVAKRIVDGVTRYSLSCNTDTTLDMLRARAEGRASFKLVGQVNSELPFMPGAGDLPSEQFSAVLDSHETDFPLFAPPSEPITDTKYAIGLHAAGLVRDGGTLQIGIGQAGDALAQGLILRHHDNAGFHGVMKRLTPDAPVFAEQTGTFEKGLYGVSEMLFEAFLALMSAGILKREVDGVALHGAFFLGPKSFYRALREMTPEQLARIQMMPVSFTNQLYGDEEAKRRARVDARFVNNAMMATLMGAAISDGLEDGQVVSGVGGQYNFVAQAFELPGARSILTVEATRQTGARSNIRWSYGHTTIPRHLRDVVVTEYGVADIRGKSDADVIAAMLAVTDSRFQDELAREAKDAGKLPKDFAIPPAHRENFPQRITAALKPAREAGLLPSFPFGSDFTDIEQRLIPALQLLQDAQRSPRRLLGLLWLGFTREPDAADNECLARLGLDAPATLSERAYRALVGAALVRSRAK